MRSLALPLAALVLLSTACDEQTYIRLTPPLLLVSSELLDFGDIPVGFQVGRRITLANGGQEELTIRSLGVEGDLSFVLASEVMRIAPGQQAEVRITFAPQRLGAVEADLLIESDASNTRLQRVGLRGAGVSATSCGACNSPPPARCLTEGERVFYTESGVCVMGECEYTALMESCAEGCEAGACRGAAGDAGVGADSGEVPDSGEAVDTGVSPDSGVPSDSGVARDSGVPSDSGVAPDSGVTPDAGPADPCADAGITDSGLGAPAALFEAPGEHTFVVPGGVTQLAVRMWGGGGQGGNQSLASGGGGAFVEARVPVTAGEQLQVWVAQGGNGSSALGFGGGASYLRRGGDDLLVAAGGGGGGSDGNSGNSMAGGWGGAGGPAGENGGDGIGNIGTFCTQVTGGRGATATAGGAGGTNQGTAQYRCMGQPGGRSFGGRATGTSGNCQTTPGAEQWRAGGGQANGGGGGGGSGYFGGGGAGFIWTYCGGGGGGGASFAAPGLIDVHHDGGSGARQGRPTESFGAGRGGDRCLQGFNAPPCTCNHGGDGRVEIRH